MQSKNLIILIINDKKEESINFLKKFNIVFDKNNKVNIKCDECTEIYKTKNYLYFNNYNFGNSQFIKTSNFKNQICSTLINYKEKLKHVFIRISNVSKIQLDEFKQQYDNEMIHVMNFGKTIILNKCFTDTRYSVFGTNICHEAVNAFICDNNSRYFYLTSSGYVGKDRFVLDDYKKLPVNYFTLEKSMLLSFTKVQIKEGGLRYIFTQKVENFKLFKGCFDKKLDPNKFDDITYNGKPLVEIFANNYYENEKDEKISLNLEKVKESEKAGSYITFESTDKTKVSKQCVPANFTFNPEDEGYKGHFSKHERQFVYEGTTLYAKLVEDLKKINWVPDSGIKIDSKEEKNVLTQESVLEIVGAGTEETSFSKLFAYCFRNSFIFTKIFLHELYGDEDLEINEEYIVDNEEKNIDIFLKFKDSLLVIENKINATITEGQKTEWYTKLKINKNDKKYEYESKLKNQIDDEFKNYKRENLSKRDSQLAKYYLISKYIARFNKLPFKKSVRFIILCPEYYCKKYKSYKDNFYYGENYRVVSYKTLAKCLKKAINYTKLNLSIRDTLKETYLAVLPYIESLYSHQFNKAINRFKKESLK